VVTGYAILYFSLFCFALVLVIPFFPLSAGLRAALWTGTLVTAEVGFWVGVFVAGPDLLARVRGWMAPVKRLFRPKREPRTVPDLAPAIRPSKE
jgi:hypothetical protein